MMLIQNLFSLEELETLQNLPEVLEAQARLSRSNVVNFRVTIPESVRETLSEKFGIQFPDTLPFRWIRGDTAPHVDRGAGEFDNTYLVYLTDGEGQFEIGEETYPIEAGEGFTFSEGTRHGVTQANDTTRLLLGPMSEAGLAVGFGGTNVSADGATNTIYIQQSEDPSGNPVYAYRINNGELQVLVFPLIITNTNATPADNILKVLFTTDLTFTTDGGYIQINSNGIQIGDTAVKANGTKYTITIDGVTTGYGGFVQNDGWSHIFVYNLHVAAINGSTLSLQGGWVGRYQYGREGNNNYIIGCSSDGPISDGSGGIVGANASEATLTTPDLTIVGCTSSGSIGAGAGGIAGQYAPFGAGSSLYIIKCSSSGTIGADAGGIAGAYAGQNGAYCEIDKCYSMGTIDVSAGGIVGLIAGDNGQVIVTNSYSRGNIGTDGGGIFGENAADNDGLATATNCYSSGSLTTAGTGIFGSAANVGATQTNSYVANGSWSDASAIAAGLNVSTIYISTGTNTPYELRAIGPSPYSLTTIDVLETDMSLSSSQSVAAGSSSIAAVLAGLSSFSILSGGDATITINSSTGAISTTTATPVSVYTLLIRAVTNPYSITTFTLTVTEAPPPPSPATTTTAPFPTRGKGYDFETYNKSRVGERLVRERLENPNIRFKSFEDYNKYKMALLKLQGTLQQ